MVHSMKVTGKTINYVGQVNLQKLMEPYTRVTFLMAKCTVKGNTAIKMGLHKKVIGLKVSKMAMDGSQARVASVSKATGSREKSSGGLTTRVSGVTRMYLSQRMHQINNLNLDSQSNNKMLRRVTPCLPDD